MSPNPRRPALFLAVLAIAAAGAFGQRQHAALTRASPYLTRAEAATIILLARPAPLAEQPASHPYVDVLPGDWFARTLLAAAKEGVVSPDTTGTKLRPFGTVNRAQFLGMLSRAFKAPAPALFAQTEPTDALRLVTQDEAADAMRAFLASQTKADEDRERRMAAAQAKGQVQLYTVISTKRTRVVFVDDAGRALTHAAPPPAPAAAAPAPADDVRAEVLALVNAARADAGLAPLRRDAALERSAQDYAARMNAAGFFSHVDPDGGTLKDRIDAAGYYERSFSEDCRCIKGYALAENLARGQRSAEEVVKAWMDSPSHRDAILGKDYADIGVGIKAGVWVQHFGGLLEPE